MLGNYRWVRALLQAAGIDRTPTGPLEQVLETICADRARMDDYRAIVARRPIPTRAPWWLYHPPMIIYRKDNKFRVDVLIYRGRELQQRAPPEHESMESGWRARIATMIHHPFNIVRGSVEYAIKTQGIENPDGSVCLRVESIDTRWKRNVRGKTFPPYYSIQPEFVCRPPMGISSRGVAPTLETDAGANGQAVLTVRHDVRHAKEASGDPRIRIPDASRYWLDPARGYAAVRWDMLEGEPDAETCFDSTIIDDMDQSPSGVWYATQFRRIGQVRDDKRIESVTSLYVDFDVDLPGSLFHPPAVGQRFE